VRIRAQGREFELRAVDASNVTVEPLPAGESVAARRRTLADVPEGEAAQVIGLSPACQGPQRRRLLDLGVVPGTRIAPELVSTAGDPVAYRIRGALIALRREQAAWIEVQADVTEKVG
jgi:DtxR family Mn-dependent transcriptional regulator